MNYRYSCVAKLGSQITNVDDQKSWTEGSKLQYRMFPQHDCRTRENFTQEGLREAFRN